MLTGCLTEKELRKNRITDVLCYLLLAAVLCILIHKAPYGFCQNDEAFYLTVPYRMAQGDVLLVNEWHPSQLSAFLLYPAMRLYLLLIKSTEGMVLAFRYLFAFAQLAAALYFYCRAKKYGRIAAALAAVFFALYAPFNIMALSYNSLGILLVVSAGVTLVSGGEKKGGLMLSGLLFAGAVLCCPYLAILYFVYSAVYLAANLHNRSRIAKWFAFTAGVLVLVLIFAAYLLSKASMKEIVFGIRQMLNDSEHTGASGVGPAAYFRALATVHPKSLYFLCATVLLSLVIIADRRRTAARRRLYLLAGLIISALYCSRFIRSGYINFLMLPLSILGWFAFLLAGKKSSRWFFFLYLPGILYGFLICLGSNQGYYAISSTATVSSVASIMMLSDELDIFDKDNMPDRAAGLLLALFIVFQIGMEAHYRLAYTYNDGFTDSHTRVLAYGPQKGIRTSPGEAGRYCLLLEDTAPVRNLDAENVLYLTADSWLYLADAKKSSSYSGWISPEFPEDSVSRLLEYWEINPEKKPDVIYIDQFFPGSSESLERLNIGNRNYIETQRGYIINYQEVIK